MAAYLHSPNQPNRSMTSMPGVRSRAPFGFLLAILLMLPACGTLPYPSDSPSPEPPNQHEETEHAGPIETTSAVWWMGLACAGAGVVMTVGWIAGWKFPLLQAVPSGSGVAAVGVGVSTMIFADWMARHWWLSVLLVVGVFGAGIFEWLMKRRWFRQWVEQVKSR